jgi:SAM-dependent methyltransferase
MDDSERHDGRASTAEFYDHIPPYVARQDVAFYVDVARQYGGPVLEIGCGTGRILIPTARAGIEIVGLDNSESMLSVCREKLAREPPEVQLRVELLPGDMRDFDLGRSFNLVTIPFRVFLHLITVEEQLSCLACIRSHLSDDGRLVLDLFNPYLERLVSDRYLEERPTEGPFTLPDGRKVFRGDRVASRDLFAQVQQVEMIYHVTHPDGREERVVHAFPFRYLFRFEAEHLLARSGFEVEEVYADFDRSPYGSKYPGELIFVARKA